MDDWVLENLGIPSVTNEIGREDQYHNEWEVKSREDAREIVLANTPWLEFTYEKLGAEMAVEPLWYERNGDQATFAVKVTNQGLSAVSQVF